MREAYLKAILVGIIIIVVSSCSRYVVREGSYAPQRITNPKFAGSHIRWNNVSLLDKSIRHKILVESTDSSRSPTGTLKVWAILHNRTDYPLQVEARTSFYGRDKAPIEAPTAWSRIYLPPNSTTHYEALSTRVDVGYYNIEVREGR